MKYLLSLLLIGISLISVAQSKCGNKKYYNDFTPEQKADLQTKRMALTLDLTSTQQKKIFELNKQMAVDRSKKMQSLKSLKENGKTFTTDERFQLINERLNKQLDRQNKLKQILSENQYELWKNNSKNKFCCKHKMGQKRYRKNNS